MGIRNLNSFLRRSAPDAIRLVQIADLAGKRIAVDANNYIYRFAASGNVIEGVYQLVGMFQRNGVALTFIFDGKPPEEKIAISRHRNEDSNAVKPTKRDMTDVQALLTAAKVPWVRAQGEAEHYCAEMAKSGMADGCLTEDTDVFVYGAPVTYRYLSLLKETAVEYDWQEMRKYLGVSQTKFRHACIACGCDYCDKQVTCNLEEAMYTVSLPTTCAVERALELYDSGVDLQTIPRARVPRLEDGITQIREIARSSGLLFCDQPW